MGILDGKTGLIFGVANERSIAWHIAQHAVEQGAECAFSFLPREKMEGRVRKALSKGGLEDAWTFPCDVSSDEDLDRLFDAVGEQFSTLDFVVHSVAFADREYLKPGTFAATPRSVFAEALDVSTYTLIAIANRAVPLMTNGGSVLALSYYGAEKAALGYNVMGVAKSALESATRYLAMELGEKNIRVNSISGGPLKTLSSMAVGGFSSILDWVEEKAPLKRNVTGEDVGNSAVWLLSDMSSGVTGQVLYVDCGYSSVGL